MSEKGTIRILIADDSYLTRAGIQSLIDAQDDMTVVAVAEDGVQALAKYREHKPDVVVCDLRMPELDGIKAIALLSQEDPPARVLVLTNYENNRDVYEAVQAGALGYLGKDSRGHEVVTAIRVVRAGRRYLPPEVAERLADRITKSPLSGRELEVLDQIFKGLSNKAIGAAMELSAKTIEMYVSSILTKLGAKSRTEAVAIALKNGVIAVQK